MTNVVSFSGGKDSTALVLWALDNLINIKFVFADTGWESPITYEYIEKINKQLLNGKLHYLKSEKYNGFKDLVEKQKSFPTTIIRACTNELKIIPIKKFIDGIKGPKTNLVGLRAEESKRRAMLEEKTYDDFWKCTLWRPLLKWTSKDVFDYIESFNVEINPLYKMGMKRVGCMPCIMCGLNELKEIQKRFPERINEVVELEKKTNGVFFSMHTIPERFRTKELKSGIMANSVEDILKYIKQSVDQIDLFEEEKTQCFSHYNLCE